MQVAFECGGGLVREMYDYAREAAPLECAGLLFGSAYLQAERPRAERLERVANAHSEPRTNYLMEAESLVAALSAARGDELLAVVHSHPSSEAVPSAVDIRDAVKSGWLAPFYVIVAPNVEFDEGGAVRAFRILADGRFVECAILVV